jgi:hypothetical protein
MQNVIIHWFLVLALVGLSQACEDETNSATSGLTTPSSTADVIADAGQPEDSSADNTDSSTSADTAATSTNCGEEKAVQCRSQGKACALNDDNELCIACPTGQHPAGPLALCAPIAGDVRSYDFGELTLEPGQELNGWCQQWRLGNEEPIWVNTVEFMTDGGYHHSNWFFVPEDSEVGQSYPEGLWKNCYAKGFDELEAALAGGVIFAQSTQVDSETQKFRDGAAVRIPPNAIIIGATHLLNVEPNPKVTGLRMNLYTIPEEDVDTRLLPMRLSYLDLRIPPNSQAEFSSTCDFRSAYESQTGKPFAAKLHYVLPHYHGLGTGFELTLTGGALDGTSLVADQKFSSDPFGRLFDPPVDLSEADGFRFACRYTNTFDKVITWGIGDNEMCVMLGFLESDRAFDATVLDSTETETVDGVLKVSGACSVFSLNLGAGAE